MGGMCQITLSPRRTEVTYPRTHNACYLFRSSRLTLLDRRAGYLPQSRSQKTSADLRSASIPSDGELTVHKRTAFPAVPLLRLDSHDAAARSPAGMVSPESISTTVSGSIKRLFIRSEEAQPRPLFSIRLITPYLSSPVRPY